MGNVWENVPEVDILVTHSPPARTLSHTDDRDSGLIMDVGCKQLLNKIEEIKPKICLYGHIHDGQWKRGQIINYGTLVRNGVFYYNCSAVTDRKNELKLNPGHILEI